MPTDKQRLDFLQKRLNIGKKVICRQSIKGRGWRLHETSRPDGVSCIREAIDKFVEAIEEFNYEGK